MAIYEHLFVNKKLKNLFSQTKLSQLVSWLARQPVRQLLVYGVRLDIFQACQPRKVPRSTGFRFTTTSTSDPFKSAYAHTHLRAHTHIVSGGGAYVSSLIFAGTWSYGQGSLLDPGLMLSGFCSAFTDVDTSNDALLFATKWHSALQ